MSQRIVIALLFLSGFYTLEAQTLTWKELNNQATALYDKAEYEKAIPIARQAIEAAGREFGYDHENYVKSSNLLANIFFDTGDYETAERLFLDVLNRKKKLYGEHHASYAGTLLDLGIMYSERTGQYNKAESILTRYTEIIKGLKGERSVDYATALNTLANVYTSLDSLKKAERLYTKARALRKELLGADHEDYLSTTKNLGYLYSLTEQYPYAISCLDEVIKQANASVKNKGEDYALNVFLLGKALMAEGIYKRADTALLQAAELYKELYGEPSADYAGCINQLGLLYDKTGFFEKARTMFQKTLGIIEKTHGDTSSHYATVANNLALLYDNHDSLQQASRYYNLALGILEKNGEAATETIIILLNNLAQVHFTMKKNSEAEAYFSRASILVKNKDYQSAFEIVIKNRADFYETTQGVQAAEDFLIREAKEIKNRTGVHNSKYIFLVKLMASVYMITGRTEEAEINFLEVRELLKEWVGDKDPQYAEGLNLLAGFYTGLGRFEKSLPLLLEAAHIFQSTFGQRNSTYIHCFNQIAMISLETGQYQLAQDLFVEMKELTAEVFGTRHKEYAYALARIGHVYYKTKKYDRAHLVFEEAGKILKEISGDNTTDYHIIVNNLALLHLEKNEFDKAAETFEKVRAFFQKEIIAEPQNYISATTNLAKAYMGLGKDQEAEALLRESIAVLEKRQGAENARTILEKRTLADLYIRAGHYKKASGILDSLTRSFLGYIQNSFAVLTEKSRNEYLLQHSYLPDLSNSLHFLYRDAPAYFTQRMWGYQLLLKSLSLDDTKAMLASVQQHPDSSLRNLFRQWKTLKAKLAYQYSLPAGKRDPDLHNLNIRLDALERDINHRSTLLGKGKRYDFIPVQELAEYLNEGEAVIDFVRFEFYHKTWTDSLLYAAYVLRKGDSVPVFVPLFEEKQLQRILDSAGTTATSMVNNIYRGLEGKSKAAANPGTDLYQLIWARLEPHLKGISRISYSPAGKLYGIAFHALPVDSTTLLMDKYELRQYTSTRQVALRKIENGEGKIERIALFGDATFTMDSIALAKTKGKGQASGIYIPGQRGERSGGWPGLPGTAEEIKKIKALFDANKITTISFAQSAASEENLKALHDQSPQVLHIATHGFFLPEPDTKKKERSLTSENSYTLAEDPLLRSGLILAGGNYAWSGKTPIEGVEDGIATAYEISQLNLSNTELVVLSACETALGDIKGSEGVFGLQRAFKMAGVKKMIVSLWQVPDKETAELMTTFYTHWLKGKTIEAAFAQAQGEMRKKYPPYYWGAFVLVE